MNTFRILTFNTWLVRTPFGIDVAKKINERFSLLPDSLASLDADVICLQEVWSPALRRSLREKMAALGYPHCAGGEKIGSASFFILRFIHNFFGNGLLIFSRYPISTVVQPSIFRKFTRLDEFLIKKGAIGAEILLPSGEKIFVGNTHLGALSFSASKGAYARTHQLNRLKQAGDLVKWLKKFPAGTPLFLAADLNVHFQKWQRHGLTNRLSREVALLLSERVKKFKLEEVSLTLGTHSPMPEWTFHCDNPFVASGFFGHLPNEVTDYLFYRPATGWSPVSVRRVFMTHSEDARARGFPLSDHYGLLAEFQREVP